VSLLKQKRKQTEIWGGQLRQKPFVKKCLLRVLAALLLLKMVRLSPQLQARRALKAAGSSAKNTGMTSSTHNHGCLTVSFSAIDLSAKELRGWGSASPVSAATGAAPFTSIMREQQHQKKDRVNRVQLADSVWQQVAASPCCGSCWCC